MLRIGLKKKITNKTFFVIEASSYQLEYSQFFKTNYALILNISPDHLENLAKKAIQQNSDSNWYWLSDIFIATNKFTYGRWGENRTISYHWLDDEHICLIHIHKNNEISSLHIHGCCNLLRSFNNCYDSYYLTESH